MIESSSIPGHHLVAGPQGVSCWRPMTESSSSLLWLSEPGCRQHHQDLGAVLGVQELGIDLDVAEFGVEEGLAVAVAGDLL